MVAQLWGCVMGLSQHDAERQARRLNPPAEKPVQLVTVESRTIGNEVALRGIPVAGVGGGAINGTRPGDSARALEQAGRDIVRGHLKRTRRRDHEEGRDE